MDIIKTKREIIDLAQQKQVHIDNAAAALEKEDRDTYSSEMEKARNIARDITDRQVLVTEAEARALEKPEDPQEAKDKVAERVNALRNKQPITLSTVEMLRGIRNATLVSSPITEPIGGGTDIHDIPGSKASSIIDRVQTINLQGLRGWEEPYIAAEAAAQAGAVNTLAGTARTQTNPTFAVAQIKPYEVNVTHAVDRNISNLSNADYYGKVFSLAMTAMRRKVANLIVLGDGQNTPDMFGMTTGKNKAGTAIYATKTLSALDENTLDELYYEYGTDEAVGENGTLIVSKARLKLLGMIRNSNKERVFKVNHATGMIEDGGNAIPFIESVDAGSNLIFGDPQNYLLGLFGDMTVRIDESVYADKRLIAILGDAIVGGNIVAHHGFVVGSVTAQSAG